MQTDPDPLGTPAPAPRSRRLLNGRGRYVADLLVPGCLEAAFLRSPFAHARITGIDTAEAAGMPGVVAVLTGADIARVCAGYRGTHALFPALKAPLQHPIAIDKALWSGEPVAMVVASSRARAEDALEAIAVDYEELPALTRPADARDPASPPLHDGFADNIVLHQAQAAGDPEATFHAAARVVDIAFGFNRHSGVPLETRGIIADFEAGEQRLTVHQSHQCPHQMQTEYARLLGLRAHLVRVIAPDVGGAFGIKQQLYGDELATCAASVLLGRPVRFIADRLESLLSDVQAREHEIAARLAVTDGGALLGFEVDDLYAIGPYSQYPRSSTGEPRSVIGLCGAPYRFSAFKANSTIVFQNKSMAGHYRGVGHPIACAVTEALIEKAARSAGIDPIELRRRNFLADADLPYRSPTGTVFSRLSFPACLQALETAVDIPALRAEIQRARGTGRLVGLGFAAFVEQTSRGPAFYGGGGVPVSTRDGASVRFEPSGTFRCLSSVTEQGQGTEMGVRQVVASALGVGLGDVEVLTGDSAATHHGGGTWGSRSMAIGGEAAWRAARLLRSELLDLADRLLQAPADTLTIRDGAIAEKDGGRVRLSLEDLARIVHFRPDELPPGPSPQLEASFAFTPLDQPFRAGCGIQMSQLEIDPDTGLIRLLRHLVVHEAGRIVNPLLVDEQIRGGVVQGLGAALFEECVYDDEGQLLSGSLADYLLPMAGEMPDIEVIHAQGAAPGDSDLGISGVGEAGTIGAAAAVMTALNDALAPQDRELYRMPFTPDRVLRALGVI